MKLRLVILMIVSISIVLMAVGINHYQEDRINATQVAVTNSTPAPTPHKYKYHVTFGMGESVYEWDVDNFYTKEGPLVELDNGIQLSGQIKIEPIK